MRRLPDSQRSEPIMPRTKKQPAEETTGGAPPGGGDAGPAPAATNGADLPSKRALVLKALEQGCRRKPQAIQEHLNDTYNVPRDYVSAAYISSILSEFPKPGRK